MSLWNDVKKNLGELYSVTSEKSTEVARITSRRYDKFGIRREIERQYGELGNFVYQGLKEGRQDLMDDPVARQLIDRIDQLETELAAKDEEIERIRREAAEKEAEADEQAAANSEPGRRSDAAATVLKGPALHEGSDESAILVEPAEAEEEQTDEKP